MMLKFTMEGLSSRGWVSVMTKGLMISPAFVAGEMDIETYCAI